MCVPQNSTSIWVGLSLEKNDHELKLYQNEGDYLDEGQLGQDSTFRGLLSL